jgi:hypothetical protein
LLSFIGERRLLELIVQRRGPPSYFEAARKHAGSIQAAINAIAHRRPDLVQTLFGLRPRTAGVLIRQYNIVNVGGFLITMGKQFLRGRKWKRTALGARDQIIVRFSLQLFFGCNKSAAN